MKIAIFMQNRPQFGATLMHIPLVYSLKQSFPDAEITLFSKNSSAEMLLSVTATNIVNVTKKKIEEIRSYRKFDPDISISLRKNSLPVTLAMILFNRKSSYGYGNLLARLFFTKTIDFDQSLFRADSYLSLLPEYCEKKFLPSQPDKEKRICLMPGGAFDWKHWEIKNYLQLADRLQSRLPEYTICFVMGAMEEHYVSTIEAWHHRYAIHMDTPLHTLFELVQGSELIIANDCGPSHVAQISDVRNIILYSSETNNGHAVAKEWFREKEGSSFIVGEENRTINSIEPSTVYEAALKALSLKP